MVTELGCFDSSKGEKSAANISIHVDGRCNMLYVFMAHAFLVISEALVCICQGYRVASKKFNRFIFNLRFHRIEFFKPMNGLDEKV